MKDIYASIFSEKSKAEIYLGIFLLFITASMTLLFYKNAPYIETDADIYGYLSALHQLQTTGNPVNALRLPTYPLFLMTVYALAGQGNLRAVSIVQGMLFICSTGEIYVLTLLIMGRKWIAFFVGLLIGTNFILLSYVKPIMPEGLSLWLLTTMVLCVMIFLKTLRPLSFWLGSLCLLFLLFIRPEWIILPCLLLPYIVFRVRKKFPVRGMILRVASVLVVIYLLIGGYSIANAQINGVAGLSMVSNMNLIGKMIQYRMQDETPYNSSLSRVFDQFIRQGITSPYQITGHSLLLGQNHAQASADFARDIILHHPVQFLVKSIPLFFTSLYHYNPVGIFRHNGPGPYDKLVNPILSIQQYLYTINIFFPLCALIWLILCCYRKTRDSFCVQTMGLLVLIITYAVIMTTLGSYDESSYTRINTDFNPLIILVIWGSFGLSVYRLGSFIRRRKFSQDIHAEATPSIMKPSLSEGKNS